MSYTWFRVDSSVVDHPKVADLEVKMQSPLAGWYVIRLWSWAQRYATDGRFMNSRAAQVEAACRWSGPAGKLIEFFVEVGLLDPQKKEFEVHDWSEFQGKLVEKSRRDSAAKKAKRLKEKEEREKTARAARAPGAPTYETDGRDETRRDETDEKLLEAPDVTPAISVAVAVDRTPPRVEKNWGLVGEQLADWARKQRACMGNFGPDRESDIAAVHSWALSWCLKHEPDERALDQMRETFNAFLGEQWAIERDCALALWATENVWLPRWNNQRAAEAA